jgi:hypothetical protein
MKTILNILKYYKIMLILIVFILSITNIKTNKQYIDIIIAVLELIYNLL